MDLSLAEQLVFNNYQLRIKGGTLKLVSQNSFQLSCFINSAIEHPDRDALNFLAKNTGSNARFVFKTPGMADVTCYCKIVSASEASDKNSISLVLERISK